MKIKPKDIQVNLPIVLIFKNSDEITSFASSINTIIHGKVKVKYDEIGSIDGKYIGIFYLQRNEEYQRLRESFIELIETMEMNNSSNAPYSHDNPITLEERANNDLFIHLELAGMKTS